MNIAILDDHELIRLGLRSTLQGTGHSVTDDEKLIFLKIYYYGFSIKKMCIFASRID